MKNLIFKFSETINLGKLKVTSSGSTTVNPYFGTDDERFKDLTTLKVSPGDKVYWKNPYEGNQSYDYSYDDKSVLGTLTSGTISTRITMAAATPVQAFDATKAFGFFRAEIIRVKGMVSYPANLYRGSSSFSSKNKNSSDNYNQDMVSLFFERTPGYLDEVRLDVKPQYAYSVIRDINQAIKKPTEKDLVFVHGIMKPISPGLLRVNNVLSSIISC